MKFIKEVLSDLEHHHDEKNENEYVSESKLYEFILDKIDDRNIDETLCYYFKKLASVSISKKLIEQANHGKPLFSVESIFDLLLGRDDNVYLHLYNYYIGELSFIESHTINNENFFIGENLKIKYNSLIQIFAMILRQELNTAVEKVSKILLTEVNLGEWDYYIFAGSGEIPVGAEKDLVDSTVNKVLK